MTSSLKIAIIGHIDHGKSTLMGRLMNDTNSLKEGVLEEIKKICKDMGKDFEFAYIADYLREEREQEKTIDTTQMFFKTPKRDYVIIDAPGHKEFLKNMITGTSQADAAVLIVDASKGVEEQTKRHAFILSMLGIKQIIVAVNKMDLVNYDKAKFETLSNEIRDFLEKVKVKPTFFVPVSAKVGDNITKNSAKMPWYKGKPLLEVLDGIETAKEKGELPLRLPVQDVYEIDSKKIIVGRIEAGEIKVGEEIVFLPDNVRTTVLDIRDFLESKKSAHMGKNVGVIIKDNNFLVERGQLICEKTELPTVTKKVRASVFVVKDRLLKGQEIFIKCSTQKIGCKIEKIEERIDPATLETIEKDAAVIEQGEVANVTLAFEDSAVFDDFNRVPELGRFVIERDFDPIAGGTILI